MDCLFLHLFKETGCYGLIFCSSLEVEERPTFAGKSKATTTGCQRTPINGANVIYLSYKAQLPGNITPCLKDIGKYLIAFIVMVLLFHVPKFAN